MSNDGGDDSHDAISFGRYTHAPNVLSRTDRAPVNYTYGQGRVIVGGCLKASRCCVESALDFLDLDAVWGFGSQIPARDWVQRIYGDEGCSWRTAGRSWDRLKARLRKHGIALLVPAQNAYSTREDQSGDRTWLVIPRTKENVKAAENLVKTLDFLLVRKH